MNGSPRVALFDYGAGNLHSLKKALEAGGTDVAITGDWNVALEMDALVLPGVGSFGAAVRGLEGHESRVREALENGLPCLGICLGMQLFFDASEEGSGAGIGIIPGQVRKLRTRLIPQMGWNDVDPRQESGEHGGADPLFTGLETIVAYYANSFVCEPDEQDSVIATTEYQGDLFPAAVRRGATWGVQFHPEKSSSPGLRLIRNFLGEVTP
jgi:glutamine amidotransferase